MILDSSTKTLASSLAWTRKIFIYKEFNAEKGFVNSVLAHIDQSEFGEKGADINKKGRANLMTLPSILILKKMDYSFILPISARLLNLFPQYVKSISNAQQRLKLPRRSLNLTKWKHPFIYFDECFITLSFFCKYKIVTPITTETVSTCAYKRLPFFYARREWTRRHFNTAFRPFFCVAAR
jgi:hypothetical protein